MKLFYKKNSKSSIFTYLGTLLEYYDYILFMEFAHFISKIFFPENMNSIFYIFALGYASRFIGIFIISLLSNQKEQILKISVLLMSVSTLVIALMPSYSSIGITATCLLIGLRFLQSVSYAVEFPSAIKIASDNDENQNSKIGMVISSTTVGAILASLSSWTLLYFCSKEQILSYYWRIPFMISGLFGLLLFRMRSFNTNKITQVQRSITEFSIISSFKPIVNSVLIMVFTSFLIVNYLYFPQFFAKHGYTDLYFIHKYKLIMLCSSILFVTVIGKILDRMDKKRKINAISNENFNQPINNDDLNNLTSNNFVYNTNILYIYRIFIIVWTGLVLLSMTNKIGIVLLMLFSQLSIAFGMHYGLKNMVKQCGENIIASIIAYNLSMFLGSLIVSFATNWAYMVIIPLALSSVFTFRLYKNQR
ncbi:MFS transporter [Candidatus Cytomitobacter primus]|uniref:MFS transporter n=1 Tax=Candidatus Cytomitobacter primus TaxID=2066024 RepID=A0A5C0UF94_9PROT|nr:MFS transporter [Candidatus Cytomitobacter primus]QEK38449.1 MFS transporter [Candidatus Cytomitobacter primus]